MDGVIENPSPAELFIPTKTAEYAVSIAHNEKPAWIAPAGSGVGGVEGYAAARSNTRCTWAGFQPAPCLVVTPRSLRRSAIFAMDSPSLRHACT